MEQKVLLELNVVVKNFFVLVFLLTAYSAVSQEPLQDSNSIIPYLIGQDTLPKSVALKILSKGISDGKYTKDDSLKYIKNLKRKKLRLLKLVINKRAQEILSVDVLDKGVLSQYLSAEKLLEIINKIPQDSAHDTSMFAPKIEIINTKEDCPTMERCHAFSKPLLIEGNRYLIYHEGYLYPKGGNSEFVIYCIKTISEGHKIVIEKRINPLGNMIH